MNVYPSVGEGASRVARELHFPVYMKTRSLVLLATLFIVAQTSNYTYANTAPAAPGTSSSQDTKNQHNNPPGPTAQNTGADLKQDSKKDRTANATSPTSTTIPGAPAGTKSPQSDMEADKK